MTSWQTLESLPGGCTDSVAVGFCVVKGIEGLGGAGHRAFALFLSLVMSRW